MDLGRVPPGGVVIGVEAANRDPWGGRTQRSNHRVGDLGPGRVAPPLQRAGQGRATDAGVIDVDANGRTTNVADRRLSLVEPTIGVLDGARVDGMDHATDRQVDETRYPRERRGLETKFFRPCGEILLVGGDQRIDKRPHSGSS